MSSFPQLGKCQGKIKVNDSRTGAALLLVLGAIVVVMVMVQLGMAARWHGLRVAVGDAQQGQTLRLLHDSEALVQRWCSATGARLVCDPDTAWNGQVLMDTAWAIAPTKKSLASQPVTDQIAIPVRVQIRIWSGDAGFPAALFRGATTTDEQSTPQSTQFQRLLAELAPALPVEWNSMIGHVPAGDPAAWWTVRLPAGTRRFPLVFAAAVRPLAGLNRAPDFTHSERSGAAPAWSVICPRTAVQSININTAPLPVIAAIFSAQQSMPTAVNPRTSGPTGHQPGGIDLEQLRTRRRSGLWTALAQESVGAAPGSVPALVTTSVTVPVPVSVQVDGTPRLPVITDRARLWMTLTTIQTGDQQRAWWTVFAAVPNPSGPQPPVAGTGDTIVIVERSNAL